MGRISAGVLGVVVALALASAGAAAPVIGSNILTNVGFESDDHANSPPPAGYQGWVLLSGNWDRRSSNPAPSEGSYYYYAGACALASIYQDRDLAALGYDPFRLDTGGYYADYGGNQFTYNTWPNYDGGMIGVDQYNSGGAANGSSNLGWQYPLSWTWVHGSVRLNPGTTQVRYGFVASRAAYTSNDAYLDAAYLIVNEYGIWTWGNNTANYAGAGPWNTGTAEVHFGDTSAGGVAVTKGATLTTGGTVRVGAASGSSGTVRLAGGSWNPGGAVLVGDGGAGSVTVDAGGNWNTAGAVSVGSSSSGVVTLNPGGQWTSPGLVVLGTSVNGTGTINLNGGTWNPAGGVNVGDQGSGVVNLNPGGQWAGSGAVTLGYSAGGKGTINLNGGNWSTSAIIVVGVSAGARGVVNVNSGSQWTCPSIVALGWLAGSGGTVNLNGGTWNTTSGFVVQVGGEGSGVVNVNTGGQWTSPAPVSLGAQSVGATGTVNISGGSWSTAGDVYVGRQGSGVVNLNPGGQWTGSGSVYLGYYANATGTVTFNGGNWNPAGDVYVGFDGSGKVNLNPGGQWIGSGLALLGYLAGSTGTATLNGGNWNPAGDVYVGWSGSGVVNLNSGSQWTCSGSVMLGYCDNGIGTINVNGGSHWYSPSLTLLGEGPGSNAIVNLAGGTWTADGEVLIGGEPGSGGDAAINLTAGTMAVAGRNLVFRSRGTLTLDGARLNLSRDATLPGDRRFDFRSGTLQVDEGRLTWPGAHTLSAGSNIILSGYSARWEPSSLTVGDGASLTLDGATLHLAPGSVANFSSPIIFGARGGRMELDHALLIHAAKPLALSDVYVVGSGEIVVGSAGINLGSTGHPGTLAGTSQADRLLVYGNLSGSGTVRNTTVFGNVTVGNSPGQMMLENVLLGSGSTLVMEIAGADPGQFDRLILGPGVDLGSCPVDITFAGGFAPDPASTFDLFEAAGGGDLLAALGPATIHTPTDWVLDRSTGVVGFVPEPATLALLALGGLVALLRRRR